MKNAIFFDIDGTIVDSGNGKQEMTLPVQQAIRSLQKRGDYVFIATGRPYAFLHKSILEFGFDGFILANGAQAIVKDQTIYKSPMDKSYVKEMVNKFEENNIQYILEGEHHSYMKSKFQEFYAFYDWVGVSKAMIQKEYDLDQMDVLKVEMLCQDQDTEELCLSMIQGNKDYDYFHSINQRIFELYAKRNTKATGIQKVLEYLNISHDHSYAFGDGKNDIEMLSAVGCGIAMGNASDYVKQHANVVTETIGNDGVVHGIRTYIME